jgi:hypothetical protein
MVMSYFIGEARLSTDQSLVKELNRLGVSSLVSLMADVLPVNQASRVVQQFGRERKTS